MNLKSLLSTGRLLRNRGGRGILKTFYNAIREYSYYRLQSVQGAQPKLVFKGAPAYLRYTLGMEEEPELIGDWERLKDHFAGCRMRIDGRGPELSARLTYVPMRMIELGWRKMDLKCKNIHRLGICRYELLELYKQLDPLSSSVHGFFMASSLILLSSDLLQITPRKRISQSVTHMWRRI